MQNVPSVGRCERTRIMRAGAGARPMKRRGRCMYTGQVNGVSSQRHAHDCRGALCLTCTPSDAPDAWPTGNGLGCARQSSGSTAGSTKQLSRSMGIMMNAASPHPSSYTRTGAPAQSPAPPQCRRRAGLAQGRKPQSWQCRCCGAPGSPVAVAAREAPIAAGRTGWEGTCVSTVQASHAMRRGQERGCAWAKPAVGAFLGKVRRAAGRIHPACLHICPLPPPPHSAGRAQHGGAGRHAPGRGRCRGAWPSGGGRG
jgi:hypothetical protein